MAFRTSFIKLPRFILIGQHTWPPQVNNKHGHHKQFLFLPLLKKSSLQLLCQLKTNVTDMVFGTMDIFLDIIGFIYQTLRVSVEKVEGVIKSHKSKDRQCNDQKKKD